MLKIPFQRSLSAPLNKLLPSFQTSPSFASTLQQTHGMPTKLLIANTQAPFCSNRHLGLSYTASLHQQDYWYQVWRNGDCRQLEKLFENSYAKYASYILPKMTHPQDTTFIPSNTTLEEQHVSADPLPDVTNPWLLMLSAIWVMFVGLHIMRKYA